MTTARPTGTVADGAGLVHEALFYQGGADYASGIRRFLRAGLDRSEPLLVAVPGLKAELLRSALGRDAARIRFVDMTVAGRNPGRIIPTVLYAFAEEHAPHRVRIVGEPIWPGRSAAEYRAALQHEALINVALAQQQVTILCPYDERGLDATALSDARRTHPVLVRGSRSEDSADYDDPRLVADRSLRSLPEPPELWGDMLVFHRASDLQAVRRFVERIASREGLAPDRVQDLSVAVNELATNTLQHTGEAGLLVIWRDSETDSLVCEVSDSGQLSDRLVGRIPPSGPHPGGRGLLLVNTLCDLVELPTGQIGTGNTVRLHMYLN